MRDSNLRWEIFNYLRIVCTFFLGTGFCLVNGFTLLWQVMFVVLVILFSITLTALFIQSVVDYFWYARKDKEFNRYYWVINIVNFIAVIFYVGTLLFYIINPYGIGRNPKPTVLIALSNTVIVCLVFEMLNIRFSRVKK